MASLRLAHVNLLWSDEDYHLTAALQLLRGRVPYRDFWYDKPPVAALFYSLVDGYSGWPLRLLDVEFVIACCWVAYWLAKVWWGEREGLAAALLLAFFTVFYLPSATVPFAVDGLLLLPHLGAIYFAKQRSALWSGVCCAVGLLTNVKAVFVTATCAIWLFSDAFLFACGLGLVLAVAVAIGAWWGALPDFYNQVWRWGLLYAKGAPVANGIGIDMQRCLDWLAFHGALLAGVLVVSRDTGKEDRWRLSVWFALSAASLLFGNHFAPRYFYQVLPVMVIAGARGLVIGVDRYGRAGLAVLALLLVAPMIRFGPRYLELVVDNVEGHQTHWSDAALDVDSQHVARLINAGKTSGDSLFVWGYRPDVYVYTRLLPPGRFSDSQPLDGVPADRHLSSSDPVLGGVALANRLEVVKTRPSFIVDGLGLLNPKLAMDRFPELAQWMQGYQLIGETRLSRVYRLRASRVP